MGTWSIGEKKLVELDVQSEEQIGPDLDIMSLNPRLPEFDPNFGRKHRLITLGERLAAARKGKGLSQQKLAELVGITPITLLGIEKGRSNSAIMTYMKIADILGVKFSV